MPPNYVRLLLLAQVVLMWVNLDKWRLESLESALACSRIALSVCRCVAQLVPNSVCTGQNNSPGGALERMVCETRSADCNSCETGAPLRGAWVATNKRKSSLFSRTLSLCADNCTIRCVIGTHRCGFHDSRLALRAIWDMRVCVTTFHVLFVWTSGRGCNNGSNAMRLCEGSVVYPAQSIAGNGSLRVAGVAAFGGYGYTPRGTRVRRDGKGQERVDLVWMVPRCFCNGHPSLTSFFFAAVCVLSGGGGGLEPSAAGTSFRH